MISVRPLGISVICFAALIAAMPGCSGSQNEEPVDVSTLDPFMQGLVYARSGDVENLDELIAANADIVLKMNADGMTLLHYAAISSQPGTTKLLLEKGADVYALNGDDQTPLEAAESERVDETVLELLRQAQGT